MDIVYAAEKPSIASLLSDRLQRPINPEEVRVTENPDETGSFLIAFDLSEYVLAPNGEIQAPRED